MYNSIELSCFNSTEKRYKVNFYGDYIITTLTSIAAVVDCWISETRLMHDVSIVGLDTEWCLPNSGKRHGPVAILQLCVAHCCLIFQLAHADYIPESLKHFLADSAIKFVGVGIEGDACKLFNDFALSIGCTKDLRSLAVEKLDDEGLKQAGLKRLSSIILGVEIEKSKRITLSRWDSEVLKLKQVNYACIDAFVSYKIGKCLMT